VAIARRRRSGRHQQIEQFALQRVCQFLDSVDGHYGAPALVILNGADADAERAGERAV
jgi:hypothetical protein